MENMFWWAIAVWVLAWISYRRAWGPRSENVLVVGDHSGDVSSRDVINHASRTLAASSASRTVASVAGPQEQASRSVTPSHLQISDTPRAHGSLANADAH